MPIKNNCCIEAMTIIQEILKKSKIADKSRRLKKITNIYNNMLETGIINREFYSLAHEIKSYNFIANFGEAILANDENNDKGPDLALGNNRIECVCSSTGILLETGYKEYSINYCNKKSSTIDYNKTKEFLLPRITNSLDEKNRKFKKYISDKTVKDSECTIIFVSLGELTIDFHSGEYGIDLLEILIGKGPLTLEYDPKELKIIRCYWEQIENIKKNKGKECVDISANFFVNNKHISGVMFSKAKIYEKYDFTNTFLFLNPFAKNKIKIKDFKNIIYWSTNKKDEYIPMKNGKSLFEDIVPKFN